jgi:hypothetical protein
MADDIQFSDVASSALTMLAIGSGYIGSLCLFLGGLATFFPVPFIGQIGYLTGPTGSGFLYILCAGLSVYITYSGRFFLLYLTGGIAAVIAAFDILNATRLGYVIQMALGGGMSAGPGVAQDPIVAGMMQEAGFSIPTGWIILAAGIFILMITPNLASQKPEDSRPLAEKSATSRDVILDNRMKELDNLIMIYERGHITKDEFHQLKQEIMGKK